MKKTIFVILFSLSMMYSIYSLSGLFLERGLAYLFKQDFELPQQITLVTRRGQLMFNKTGKNKYCFFSTCAFIDDAWLDTLVLTWERQRQSVFIKQKDSYVQKELLTRPDIIQSKQMTFELTENKQSANETQTIYCQSDASCYLNQEAQDSSDLTLLSGAKLYQNDNGYRSDNIQNMDVLLFQKENQKRLYHKQKNGVYSLIKPQSYQPRFLLALSSYNRPVYLSGQVLRLMRQKYDNFYLSLSIKGVPQELDKITYFDEWQDFIKENRLSIRYDENAGQFQNLLNAFRHADLTKYDYVCKIDDDDWYSPNYLEVMADHLSVHPDVVLVQQRLFHKLVQKSSQVVFDLQAQPSTGSTMCFKSSFAQFLLKVEKMNDEEIKKHLPHYTTLKAPYKVALEDLLIADLAQKQGKTMTLYTVKPTYLYNMTTSSITRMDE